MTRAIYVEGRYRIVKRNDTGGLQITCNIDDKRYRFGAGKDLREAKRRLDAFRAEIESGWRPGKQTSDSWQRVATRIRERHKTAAKGRNIPFDLTVGEVYRLMVKAEFCCTISGIAFSRAEKVGPYGLTDPWAPSIDRIDNRAGYQPDNVRIVCVAANVGMNAWGYDTLLRLARGVIRKADAIVPESIPAKLDKNPTLIVISNCNDC